MESSPPPSSSPIQHHSKEQDPYTNDPRLSPLEAEVLNEYRRLKENLDTLSDTLLTLSSSPSVAIADGLRTLERQMMPVCNAFKSSVYQIVMQQQIEFDGEGEGLDAGEGSPG